jgi:WD40 repeat protein
VILPNGLGILKPSRGYQFIGNIDAPQHRANEEILASPPHTREESDSGKLTGIAVTVTLDRGKSWRKWALVGVGVLLIMGTALGLWFFRPKSHPAQKTFPLTSYPGRQITPAFSPDGKQVAFAWDGEKGDNFDIYVKLVDAGTPLRLTNNAAAEYSPA